MKSLTKSLLFSEGWKQESFAGEGKAVLPFYLLAGVFAINSKKNVNLLQNYRDGIEESLLCFP